MGGVSFPGSCAWVESHSQALVRGWSKESLVHTVCACSVSPQFLGIWEVSIKSALLHKPSQGMLTSPM